MTSQEHLVSLKLLDALYFIAYRQETLGLCHPFEVLFGSRIIGASQIFGLRALARKISKAQLQEKPLLSMTLHRNLGRTASHRRSLLRNLALALLEKESITTTWAKAKEAQSYTERIISYTKLADKEKARSLAQGKLFCHGTTLPKLFDVLGPRYKDRQGGYTRVLKLEPRRGDKAPAAILELVDGDREMKFWLCARTVARLERQGLPVDEVTQRNVEKLLRFKPDGEAKFREVVELMKEEFYATEESIRELPVHENKLKNTEKLNIEFVPRL